MRCSFARFAVGAAGCIVSVAVALGCSGSGTDGNGGSAGTGGTAGSGGSSSTFSLAVPECLAGGYDELIGFKGEEGVFSTLVRILAYVDHNGSLPDGDDPPGVPKVNEQKADFPPRASLPPFDQLNDGTPKPRVLWSTFTWSVGDKEVTAYFYQRLDEGIYGPPDAALQSFYLDLGFFNRTGAVIDWKIETDGEIVGKGTFSVNGLDNDSVRAGIVRFYECEVADPATWSLCSDPPCPDPLGDTDPWCDASDDPWYTGGSECRFEITLFATNLDLTTGGVSSPQVGFSATAPGAKVDNGLIIFRDDNTADFTGVFNGLNFAFKLSFGVEPWTVTLTMPEQRECTMDPATFRITC